MASSTIYLIRHGQASFQADEYDQLSPLGYQQASALGKWWGEHLPVPHLVAHGSLHRQRQSWESFREAASHNLPDAQILPGLNEHQGTEVMKYHAGKDAPKVDKKTALKTFFALNRRWLKGEIDSG
ncbi:MAG: phosphoglycerate mutase family protein, partial [Bacteroidota bacterium]